LGLDRALARDQDELVPYKLLAEPLKMIREVVERRLTLFNSARKMARSQAGK
jgi:hypothetical protein